MSALFTRRYALNLGLSAVAGLTALTSAGCAGDDDEPPESVPSTWTTSALKPLSYAIPEGMSSWMQETGSAQFYWDRCWATDTKHVASSDLLLVRLWGEGATSGISVATALASLESIDGTGVTVGDRAGIARLGESSVRQDFTGVSAATTLAPSSPKADTFHGALWDVTNGVSRALILLIGAGVTKKTIATVELGLKLDKQTALSSVPEGWQQRQVEGVSLVVPANANDLVPRKGFPWTAAYTVRTEEEERTASVLVKADVKGDSLNSVSDAVMTTTDVKDVANGAASSVTLSDGAPALRFDYTFSAGRYRAALLVASIKSVNYAIDVRDYGMSDASFSAAVQTVLASIRAA